MCHHNIYINILLNITFYIGGKMSKEQISIEEYETMIDTLYETMEETGSIMYLDEIVDEIFMTSPTGLEQLEESLVNEVNIMKFDQQTKLRIAELKAALLAAKADGNIKYKKMMIHRTKYKALRDELRDEYRSRGISLARRNKNLRKGK